MTTFSMGEVQVVIEPERDVVTSIAEEMIRNLSALINHDPQGDERAEIMAVLLEGLYQARNEIIRKAL